MRARDTILLLPLIAITLLAAAQEQEPPTAQRPPAKAQVAEAKAIDPAAVAEILSDQDLSPLLWSGHPSLADRDPADELIHRRGWNTKQFRNDDGSVTAIISKGSMHFQDASGHWREIRTDIRPNETGLMEQFAYAVTENRHQVYFSNTVDGGYIIHLPEGDILLGTQSELRIESAAGDVLFSIPRSPSAGIAADNRMTYEGTYPLVSGYDELIVHKRGVKHDLVLEHRPLLLDAFGDAKHLVLREFVGLPEGWSVVSAREANLATTESINNGSLLVIDENGSPVAMFPTPVIREQDMREIFHVESAKGPYTEYRVEKVSGSYRLEAAPGGVYVETLVPLTWLLNPDRIYPVVIDPTVKCEPQNSYPWTGLWWSGVPWEDGAPNGNPGCYSGIYDPGDLVPWQGDGLFCGWMYFDTSEIQDNAIITNVELNFYAKYVNWPYYNIRKMNSFTSTCSTLKSYCTSGSVYVYEEEPSNASPGWRYFDLPPAADADLESRLSSDYFGVAFEETDDYPGGDDYFLYAEGWWPTFWWRDPYIDVTFTSALPDLVPYINCLNEPWQWGDSVEAYLEICNIGNGSAGSSTARLVMSNDSTIGDGDDVTIQNFSVSPIPAGDCADTTYPWTLPDSPPSGYPANGPVWFGWIADVNNEVSESNENNNTDYDSVTLSYDPCENVPPDQAYNPGPSNQAIGVPVTTNISWSTGNCTSYSELFFGTDPTPDAGEYMGQQTSPWNPPGNLQEGTTYYWQINTFNSVSGQATEGEVWEFTTTAPLPADKWTVLVHGFHFSGDYGTWTGPGGWMRGIAERIEALAPNNLVIHTMDINTFAITPSAPFDSSKHHVLLFDWSATSNLYWSFEKLEEDGHAYAAGDALYAFVQRWGIRNKVHCLFGYSRGAVVMSELARRLIIDAVPPQQVVFIDGEGDGFSIGDDGLAWDDDRFDAWTVSSAVRWDNIISSGLYQGYFGIGGNARPRCRNLDVSSTFDHDNVREFVIQNLYLETGAYFALPETYGTWTEPTQGPLNPNGTTGEEDEYPFPEKPFNGDFEWGSRAGWRTHCGSTVPPDEPCGAGDVDFLFAPGHYLDLHGPDEESLAHSFFWLRDEFNELTFRYWIYNNDGFGCNDSLKVTIRRADGIGGTEELFSVAKCEETDGYVTSTVPIPSTYRGHVCSIRFYIHDGGDDEIDSSARIDDVMLLACTPPVTPTNAVANPPSMCAGGCSMLTASVSGAVIDWYTGGCGSNFIGTGNSIQVCPDSTTTYYARARDPSTGCVSTGCDSVTVTVLPLPTPPDSASSDRDNFCADDPGTIDLSVSGGSGNVVRWFTGGCGATSIGTGNPLTIDSPTETTTYYARWENSCGVSSCVSVTVTVLPLPVAPNSASSDRDNFCADDPGTIDLSVSGGSGDVVRWFTGGCGATSIGTGNPLTIESPTETTTYYPRWENSCGSSSCESVTVTVNPLPPTPSNASADPPCISAGGCSTLTASVSGAVIDWYTGSCGGTPIDTGNSIVVCPSSTTTYYARARDTSTGCESEACDPVTVEVRLCPADIDCSGDVGRDDLNILLQSWGPCPDCDNCPADISGDCVVDVFDLLILLGDWGPCGQPFMAGGGAAGISRAPSTLGRDATVKRDRRSGTTSGSSAMQPAGNTPLAETVRAPSSDGSVPASGHEEKRRDDGEAIGQNEAEGELTTEGDDRTRLFVNYDILEPVTFGGLVEVDRDYVQTGTGELSVELRGLLPVDDHDLVVVYGTAVLEGILSVWLADGFEPQLGDWFVIIAAESVVGEFSLVDLPQLSESLGWDVIYGPATVTVVVTAVPQITHGDLGVGMTDIAGLRDEPDGTEQLAADLNGDGVIDLSDVAILLDDRALLESLAELNADGIVDIVDSAALAILLGELEAMPLSNSELLTAIDLLADLAGATEFVSELREQEGDIDGNGVVGQADRETRLDDKPVSHSSSPAGVIDGNAVDPQSARSRRSGSTGSNPLGGLGGQQAESDGVGASGTQTATLRPSGLTLNQALALMGFSGVAEFVAWSSSAPPDQVYAAGQVLLALLTGGTSGPGLSGSPQ